MKRLLSSILALIFVMSIGSAALAAPANPFVEIPQDHWARAAVLQLAKAGIIDGYADGKFLGGNACTRYEMAQATAKAMARSDKADAENKALIDKLAVEFAAELNNLGVRVTAIEKKVDNVKFSGDIRVRYDRRTIETSDSKYNSINRSIRTRIMAAGAINEDWSYFGRFEQTEDLRSSGQNGSALTINNMYVEGPLLNTKFRVGRFDYLPCYGLVADSTLDGVRASFGKDLKVTLYHGKENLRSMDLGSSIGVILPYDPDSLMGLTTRENTMVDTIYSGVELGYALSPETNLKGAYHDYKGNNIAGNDLRIWELGMDVQLNRDWSAYATYAKSNATIQNRAYAIGIQYGRADIQRPGSWQAYANYRDIQPFAVCKPTYDLGTVYDIRGSKGWEIGFAYTMDKNILWTTSFVKAKNTYGDAEVKGSFLRSQLNFYY